MGNLLIQLLQALYSFRSPISGPNVLFQFLLQKTSIFDSILASFYESKTEAGLWWLTPLMEPEITGPHSFYENWLYFQFTDK